MKFIFPILATLLVFACSAQKKSVTDTKADKAEVKLDPYLTFDEPMHDFGELMKGEVKTFIYKFKNTGKEDVVIELVSGCECTTLEAPEGKTFKPGDTGEIKATFNSENEEGPVTKTIDVLLVNEDPETGYQIIKEVKYKAVVLEKS